MGIWLTDMLKPVGLPITAPLTLILAGLLVQSTAASAQAPAPVSSGSAITILYPVSGSTLPVGGYLQTYLAVETETNALCRYSTSDANYSSMTPFSNSNNGRYHTHHLYPKAGAQYTYYVRCQGESGIVTPAATVIFSMATAPSGAPANLIAIPTAFTHVLLAWSDPDAARPSQFRIYRDGRQIATVPPSLNTYIDVTGLAPDTLYHYAVSKDGHKSPEMPARTPPIYTDTAPYPPAMLDSFEEGLRVLNPVGPPALRHLWQPACGDNSGRACSRGDLTITREDFHAGGAALKYTATDQVLGHGAQSSSAYLRFRSMTDSDNARHNAREFVTSGNWKLDTYNRLRFWIKVPRAFANEFRPGRGYSNMNVGTYIRSSHGRPGGAGSEESGLGGSHFYHHFNIPYTGAWHQVILDMHPTHGRGASGAIEWRYMAYPTGEAGFNYFDALTVFYIDLLGSGGYHALSAYPADFYLDDFEFYKDTNPENVDQIYSLNGVYVPETNRIYVGWSHPKDDDRTRYSLRYAFQDIYSLPNKWNDAIPAPKGTISPPGSAYNLMEYSTKEVDVGKHEVIYVAIKPQNSQLFRQIVIPLVSPTSEKNSSQK